MTMYNVQRSTAADQAPCDHLVLVTVLRASKLRDTQPPITAYRPPDFSIAARASRSRAAISALISTGRAGGRDGEAPPARALGDPASPRSRRRSQTPRRDPVLR